MGATVPAGTIVLDNFKYAFVPILHLWGGWGQNSHCQNYKKFMKLLS